MLDYRTGYLSLYSLFMYNYQLIFRLNKVITFQAIFVVKNEKNAPLFLELT